METQPQLQPTELSQQEIQQESQQEIQQAPPQPSNKEQFTFVPLKSGGVKAILVKPPKQKKLGIKKRKGKPALVERSLLDAFLVEYERNGGNGTKAIQAVSNVNPIYAAQMAHTYLQQAKALGKYHMEKRGQTMDKMLERALNRLDMADSKSPDFVAIWDRLMKLGGFADFITKQTNAKISSNALDVQKELENEFIEGEIINDEEEHGV